MNFIKALTLLACILHKANSEEFDVCGSGVFGNTIRGNGTIRGDFPFLCALYNVEHNTMFCEGTLVTSKHVLTGEVE